ncbi:unnamed protein product [Symbiodinium necroappetens]|uniref:Uncharacterized protein n=1 Tax=Symbiodinium necroappetens TaxID=1628268 RepID=A0A812SIY7_9DINO|nr:unnamed protein product [Symbiodinium necroappetens]
MVLRVSALHELGLKSALCVGAKWSMERDTPQLLTHAPLARSLAAEVWASMKAPGSVTSLSAGQVTLHSMSGPTPEYGTCSKPNMKEKDAAPPAQGRLMVHGPIFVENPDGSITEAVPSDAKQARPKGDRGDRGRRESNDGDSDSSGSGSNANGISMSQEVEFLYSRHERVFMLLLFIQFVLESLYAAVFVVRMRPSMFELEAMYNWEISPKTAEAILWTTLVIQVLFGIVYYFMAVLSIWTKRPKHFQMFAKTCLCGVVGLVLLAYADKFNLPIFFLRLLAYIYARFLQGLTASILLLPGARVCFRK